MTYILWLRVGKVYGRMNNLRAYRCVRVWVVGLALFSSTLRLLGYIFALEPWERLLFSMSVQPMGKGVVVVTHVEVYSHGRGC